MAFIVPVGAVAVAGLSAYGLWRHTSREDNEAPSELDSEQQKGADGTRHKVLYALTEDALKNYFGVKAQAFLINIKWPDLQKSDDETYIEFAGTQVRRSDLSRMTGLEIMTAVNAAAAKDGAKPPYDFDKQLPKLVVPRNPFADKSATEVVGGSCS